MSSKDPQNEAGVTRDPQARRQERQCNVYSLSARTLLRTGMSTVPITVQAAIPPGIGTRIGAG